MASSSETQTCRCFGRLRNGESELYEALRFRLVLAISIVWPSSAMKNTCDLRQAPKSVWSVLGKRDTEAQRPSGDHELSQAIK